MGGKNPYLPEQNVAKPQKGYRMVIRPHEVSVDVDPSKIPYGKTGLPGSILDIAMAHGVDIDHACGGVAACSTCHVWIKKGLESCNPPLDEELDQIDNAPLASFRSRLACQAVPNGLEEVEVEIPGWNRNAVKEEH